MDAVCALASTQASLDQRMARAEATLAHSHAMLFRIMSHLGLPPKPVQPTRDQSTVAVSLDMLAAAAAAASDPSASPPLRECGGHTLFFRFLIPTSGDLFIFWLGGKFRVGSILLYVLS